MLEHSVVGIYKTLAEAEAAAKALRDSGFPIKKISIVARNLEDHRSLHGFALACDEAKPAAVTGLWLGGIFGILMAGAAFFWLPEFGPVVVAGSVAESLLCWFEGAVGGATIFAMLGLLIGLADSRKAIQKYEAALKAGKLLVIARGSGEEIENASQILTDSDAQDVERHTTSTDATAKNR